jgi:hypothetical protein
MPCAVFTNTVLIDFILSMVPSGLADKVPPSSLIGTSMLGSGSVIGADVAPCCTSSGWDAFSPMLRTLEKVDKQSSISPYFNIASLAFSAANSPYSYNLLSISLWYCIFSEKSRSYILRRLYLVSLVAPTIFSSMSPSRYQWPSLHRLGLHGKLMSTFWSQRTVTIGVPPFGHTN